MKQSRQLAAIMFTDIVGYTSLMGNNEQKALELLSTNRDIQKPIIEQYNGRWIKELGDGVMASFTTASDAVNAALRIQAACLGKADFQLRIGIHLGEVVFEQNDVFGDGVNLASRIETLGVGNSILCSKSIRDQIKNNSDFHLRSLGSFLCKNVDEAIEVYALTNDGLTVPEKDSIQGKLSKTETKKPNRSRVLIPLVVSIILFMLYFVFNKESQVEDDPKVAKMMAILPFETLQKDSAIYYLADGIPENLINRFSMFSGIKVFSRSATFGLSDSLSNVPGIRRVLNADVVLTGQIRKKGSAYVLNCQLIDAINQSQIWGNKYELQDQNVARVEDSIITALSNPLQIRLTNSTTETTEDTQVNPEAYAEYLKGRHLSYGSTPEESERALAHFRSAIQIDPRYAKAYAAIANEKLVQSLFANATKKEIVNEARISLEAAKALDPDLADIYTTEGALKFYYDWDWKGAVESYKKALSLDPGNATIFIRYSATLADVGRFVEALPLADKAIELDPISISSLHNLGWTNMLAGNFELSVEAFDKALELHPNWVWGHVKKGHAHVHLQEYDQALVHAKKAEQLLGHLNCCCKWP